MRKLRQLDLFPRHGSKFYLQNDTFSGLRNSKITYLEMRSTEYQYASCFNTGVFSQFRYLRQLKFSTAHTCNIRQVLKMLYGLQRLQMDYLKLTNNVATLDQSRALNDKDIEYLSTMCIKRVDLSHNKISKLPYNISNSRFAQCLEEIVVNRGNHFEGYNVLPLISMLSYDKIRNLDLSSSMQCAKEQRELLSNEIAISWNRTFDVNITLADSMRIVNLSLFGLSIPTQGIQWRFVGERLEILDLSYSDLHFCEKSLNISFVTSIKNLNISGLQCSNLNATLLRSMQTLETLTCQDSNLFQGLKNDPDGIFLKGLFNLSYLDLGNNQLANLHENLLQDQSLSLRYLLLQDNALRHIPKAIQNVKQLKSLNLKNNNISTLLEEDRLILDSLENANLKLSGNFFDCSCAQFDMVKWLVDNEDRIEDFQNIHCIEGFHMRRIIGSSIQYLGIWQFQLNCGTLYWLQLSTSLFIGLTLTIIVSAIGYRHRVYIKYLYLIMISGRTKFVTQSDEYEHDGFIAYSDNDYDWVTGILYKQLTHDMNMKICLHHKDFIPGNDIVDEILRCIDRSRKIIFVVTRNFLESKWANFEFRIAKYHFSRRRRSGLIVILKGELPMDEMPDFMQETWWKIVCMKWPTEEIPEDTNGNSEIRGNNIFDEKKLFWQRLKMAMES